jgi:hypothetical protein
VTSLLEVVVVIAAAVPFAAFGIWLASIDDDHAYFTSDWGEVLRSSLRRLTGRR